MKHFDSFAIDPERCRAELDEFKSLLDGNEPLQERKHILSFFARNRHAAGLIGHIAPNITEVDRMAYEFDFFGDYAADLALGDSRKQQYCFIEFENAGPDGIFQKAGKKSSLEWSKRFDHGYSQIIDWFWKLHDSSRSDAHRARFDHANSIDYCGMLVIGRSQGLAPSEVERLKWRRSRVLVDSRHIYCMTFDELYDDLVFRLKRISQAPPPVAPPLVQNPSSERPSIKGRKPRRPPLRDP